MAEIAQSPEAASADTNSNSNPLWINLFLVALVFLLLPAMLLAVVLGQQCTVASGHAQLSPQGPSGNSIAMLVAASILLGGVVLGAIGARSRLYRRNWYLIPPFFEDRDTLPDDFRVEQSRFRDIGILLPLFGLSCALVLCGGQGSLLFQSGALCVAIMPNISADYTLWQQVQIAPVDPRLLTLQETEQQTPFVIVAMTNGTDSNSATPRPSLAATASVQLVNATGSASAQATGTQTAPAGSLVGTAPSTEPGFGLPSTSAETAIAISPTPSISTSTGTATLTPTRPTSTLTPTKSPSATLASGSDLAVALTVDNPQATAGSKITYTVTLTNVGDIPVRQAALRVPVPANTSLVAGAVSTGRWTASSGQWSIGALSVGASARFKLTVRINDGTGGALLTSTAELVSASPADANSANNTATLSFLIGANATADLALTDSASLANPMQGSIFSFQIQVSNLGPGNDTGIQVSAPVPTGSAFVNGSASQGGYSAASGVWNVGGLASGSSATLVLMVQVTGAPGQVITSSAAISTASLRDPQGGNNTASASVTVAALPTLAPLAPTVPLGIPLLPPSTLAPATLQLPPPPSTTNNPTATQPPTLPQTATWTATRTATPSATSTPLPTATDTPVPGLLGLTFMGCAGPGTAQWRVTNPNPYPVNYTWQIYGGGPSGSGTAIASGNTFFTAPDGPGGTTMQIFVSGVIQSTKAGAGC